MEPKYKVGDILRYDSGPSALFKVTGISKNHGIDHRYIGLQYYGDKMGSYEQDCSLATAEEITMFRTDEHIGRLRDCPELASTN